MNKPSYSSLITCFQKSRRTDDIGGIQLWPMLAAFVVIAKVSGCVKDRICAG